MGEVALEAGGEGEGAEGEGRVGEEEEEVHCGGGEGRSWQATVRIYALLLVG